MIVLDANILIRVVLGARALDLVNKYASDVQFLAPILAFQEAERHVPKILAERSTSEALFRHRMEEAEAIFSRLRSMIAIVSEDQLLVFKDAANQRLRKRDPNDWPILAASLALNCPIWTEDMDFFGTGVPTWTTDRVEIYLQSQAAKE